MTSVSDRIPSIRAFQFDAGSTGELNAQVSTFSGDVILTEQLCTLPGPPSGAALAAGVSLRYRSNVGPARDRDNLQSPTGILGLGWSLPIDRIVLNDPTTALPGANAYSLITNDQPIALIQNGTTPDGGLTFELDQYEFWVITYDSLRELWTIVKDDGVIYTFGGRAARPDSIEWGVEWSGWVGPSSVTEGQSTYATAWNLATVADRWGNTLTYQYSSVMQAVGGTAGQSYTKACYVSSITDVQGRTITFAYREKISNAQYQEYIDPHGAMAGAPNAYQDRYETRYLQTITVAAADGTLLSRYGLEYHPLTSFYESSAAPDLARTAKRLLKSITAYNGAGKPLPPVQFDYCGVAGVTGDSPGALAQVTRPSGSITAYSYTAVSLEVCNRSITLEAPAPVGWTPGVWFGDDQVLVTWLNVLTGALQLAVYTWNGSWQKWLPSSDGQIFEQQGATPERSSFQAVLGQSYVFFSFSCSDGRTRALLLQRDRCRPSQWIPYGSAATEVPLIVYPGRSVVLSGGERFCVAVQQQPWAVARYTLDWRSGGWVADTVELSSYDQVAGVFANTTNNLLLLTVATGSPGHYTANFVLYTLGPLAEWGSSQSTAILPFTTTAALQPSDLLIALGQTTAVAVAITNEGQPLGYTVALLNWDRTYSFSPPSPQVFTKTQTMTSGFPAPVPTLVADRLVQVGFTLFRYDGTSWDQCTSLEQSSPIEGAIYTPAAGVDVAVAVANGASLAASVACFDPNAGQWVTTTGVASAVSHEPQTPVANAYHPTVAGEAYLTIGNDIFYREPASNWSSSLQAPLATFSGVIDTTSMINRADSFVAYANLDGQASVVWLKNETQLLPTTVTQQGQKITAPADEAAQTGTAPAGGAAFLTYSSQGRFSDASALTLYRFVGNGVEAPVNAWPVTAVSVSDGFGGSVESAYVYDLGSAMSDPSATFLKFYDAVSVSLDASGPPAAPVSLDRSIYFNGLSSAEQTVPNAFVQDGMLQQTMSYGVSPSFSAPWDAAYGLTSSASSTIVSAALVTLFSDHGLTLPAEALLSSGGGALWLVTDAERAPLYVITWSGGDSDPLSAYGLGAVASVANRWTVFTQRNSSPVEPDGTPSNVHGAYTRQTQVTHTVDGVPTVTSVEYTPAGFPAPYSGQPVARTTGNVNVNGETELHTVLLNYAYQFYTSLSDRGANVLDKPALTVHCVSVGGEAAVAYQAVATTWQPWSGGAGPVWDSAGTWHWRGGSAAPAFPSAQPDPAVWVQAALITHRTAAGSAAEVADATGIITSRVYASDGITMVATFQGASASGQEAAYYGFEPYETTAPWQITAARSDSAMIGTTSAKLTGGTNLIAGSFTPARQDRGYLFACHYLTSRDFAPDDKSGWTITATGRTGTTRTSFHPFAVSPRDWTFLGIPLDLAALAVLLGSPVRLAVSASMGATGNVFVDSVRLLPVPCNFSASAWDVDAGVEIGTVTDGAATQKIALDSFRHPLAHVAALDRLTHIGTQYLSSSGNLSFTTSDPTAITTVAVAGDGRLETFRSGDSWMTRWSASGIGAWSAANGLLTSSGSSGDTLTSIAVAGPDGVVLAFEIDGESSVPLTVRVGDSLALAYHGGWTLAVNGANAVPLVTAAGAAAVWLLIVQYETILFQADGRLLFSATVSAAPTGAITIATAGAGVVALKSLAFGTAPRATISYGDANGRERQRHRLIANDTIIEQLVRDGRGITTVRTKAAPGSAGSGAVLPVGVYRPGFVDMREFLQALGTTGVMTGDVASYYSASGPGTDDAGYPYRRSQLEASSLRRVVAQGAPGAANAIAGGGTAHPLAYAHAANDPGTDTVSRLLGLAAGTFQLVTAIDPQGNTRHSLIDRLQRVIAQGALLDGGAVALHTVLRSYSGEGVTITESMPEYYGGTASAGEFKVTKVIDPLGRIVATSSPDEQQSRALYDDTGRLRFLQDAADASTINDAGLPRIGYVRYDATGRPLERGICFHSWDELPQFVNELGWPTGPDVSSLTPLLQLIWDGDGTDPSAIGALIRAVSLNPATVDGGRDAVTVTETFSYDADGRVVGNDVAVSGDAFAAGRVVGVSTAYNNLDDVVRETVRDTSAPTPIILSDVAHTYDAIGRATQAAPAAGGTPYARIAYFPDGSPSTVNYSGVVQRSIEYDPTMLSLSIRDAATKDGVVWFSETLTRRYDGSLCTRSASYLTGGGFSACNFSDDYDYDALRRLTSVEGAGRASTFEYDFNGNLGPRTSAGRPDTFAYLAGTDLLSSYTPGDGSPPTTWRYAANGRVLAIDGAQRLTIDNGPGGGHPLSAIVNSATGSASCFAYGSKGHRVLKEVRAGAGTGDRAMAGLLYVHGHHARDSIVTLDMSGAVTAYVRTAVGLVAIERGGARYAVLNDGQGSTRVIASTGDGAAPIASYSYTAFGSFWRSEGDGVLSIPYLYTGQELDRELGLYNYKSRFYDPVSSRFLQPDPVRRPFSPYAYVNNDPLNLVDPTGQSASGWAVGVSFVVGLAFDVATLGGSSLLAQAGIAVLLGGGLNGLTYIQSHSSTRPVEVPYLLAQMILGGLMSAVTVGVGGAATSWLKSARPLSRLATTTLVNAASGGAQGFIAHAVAGESSQSAWTATWVSFVESFFAGAGGWVVGEVTNQYRLSYLKRVLRFTGARPNREPVRLDPDHMFGYRWRFVVSRLPYAAVGTLVYYLLPPMVAGGLSNSPLAAFGYLSGSSYQDNVNALTARENRVDEEREGPEERELTRPDVPDVL